MQPHTRRRSPAQPTDLAKVECLPHIVAKRGGHIDHLVARLDARVRVAQLGVAAGSGGWGALLVGSFGAGCSGPLGRRGRGWGCGQTGRDGRQLGMNGCGTSSGGRSMMLPKGRASSAPPPQPAACRARTRARAAALGAPAGHVRAAIVAACKLHTQRLVQVDLEASHIETSGWLVAVPPAAAQMRVQPGRQAAAAGCPASQPHARPVSRACTTNASQCAHLIKLLLDRRLRRLGLHLHAHRRAAARPLRCRLRGSQGGAGVGRHYTAEPARGLVCPAAAPSAAPAPWSGVASQDRAARVGVAARRCRQPPPPLASPLPAARAHLLLLEGRDPGAAQHAGGPAGGRRGRERRRSLAEPLCEGRGPATRASQNGRAPVISPPAGRRGPLAAHAGERRGVRYCRLHRALLPLAMWVRQMWQLPRAAGS